MKKQIFKRRLRLAFLPVYLVGAFWWLSTNGGAREALWIIGVAFSIGLAVGLISLCFRLKKAFLKFFAPGSLRAGSAAEFPRLDSARWDDVTRQWSELGFEASVDRAGNMDNPTYGQTFLRVMEHPVEGAVVEISQQFLPAQIGEINFSVTSLWGERAPVFQTAAQLERAQSAPASPIAAPGALGVAATPSDWADETELWLLITHNRAPNKFWPLLRQKRLISRRIAGEIAPRELWQRHLQQRQSVESRLQMPHEVGDLQALLEAYGLVLSAQLRRRLERTPAWKFGWARLCPSAIPADYDGELPAENSA